MSSILEGAVSPKPSPASPVSAVSVVRYEPLPAIGRPALRFLRRRPAYRMRIDYPALQVTLADPRLRRNDDELQYRFVETHHLLRELDERVSDLRSRARIGGGVMVAFTVRPRHHHSAEILARKIEELVV